MLDDVQTAAEGSSYTVHVSVGHVLLLVRHSATRNAIARLLRESRWTVEPLASIDQVLTRAQASPELSVALLDWSLLNGLLLESRRHELMALSDQIPIVLLVPQNWLRFLMQQQTGSAALLPKPFEAAELFQTLDMARARHAARRAVETPISTLAPLEVPV